MSFRRAFRSKVYCLGFEGRGPLALLKIYVRGGRDAATPRPAAIEPRQRLLRNDAHLTALLQIMIQVQLAERCVPDVGAVSDVAGMLVEIPAGGPALIPGMVQELVDAPARVDAVEPGVSAAQQLRRAAGVGIRGVRG